MNTWSLCCSHATVDIDSDKGSLSLSLSLYVQCASYWAIFPDQVSLS